MAKYSRPYTAEKKNSAIRIVPDRSLKHIFLAQTLACRPQTMAVPVKTRCKRNITTTDNIRQALDVPLRV